MPNSFSSFSFNGEFVLVCFVYFADSKSSPEAKQIAALKLAQKQLEMRNRALQEEKSVQEMRNRALQEEKVAQEMRNRALQEELTQTQVHNGVLS